MSEFAKTNQIFKIKKPKDLIVRDDLLIVLDSVFNIHIKNLCTVPSFLGEVLRISLRGDFLYLVSKDTTIAILNILDMSIIGVYKNINEVISSVIFSNRHIHIITENLLYYKTTYENINFKRVDCHEKEVKHHFDCFYNNSLKNDNTKLLLLKMLSISPNEESIVYLDVYGSLYHNGESILSFIETVKYIYTTSEKLFLIIDTNLLIYDLNKKKLEDKREIREVKLNADPFVVVSNQIINILNKKQKFLPFQFEEISFQNDKVYGFTNEGVYEIEMF